MNRTEILKAIEELASCQGSYGVFYNFLVSGSEKSKKALDILENQEFKDKVDLVLFLESQEHK